MRLRATRLTAPMLEEENGVGPVVRAIDTPK
jgi:hypothetical protein